MVSFLNCLVLSFYLYLCFGSVFKLHGQNVLLEGALDSPTSQHFKVAFELSKQSDKEQINHSVNTAACFINMYVRAGVAIESIEWVLVVHGKL